MPRKALHIFVFLAILVPIFVYFWVFDFYAVNIPKWDDHTLKEFLLKYSQATTWSERWAALAKQHNEHRIMLTRLVALVDFQIFGALNYVHLMLVGNIMLLGVILLCWLILRANNKPFYTLLPIPFIWLTLASWENMYWGMAAIQNFGVVVLVLWVLYLSVAPQFGYFIVSIILLGVTVVTSGNGLLVLPIGAVILFLAKKGSRFGIWLVMSGVYAYLYFHTYTTPDSNTTHHASLLDMVKGYMAFLGSFAEAFPVQDHLQICIIMGVVLFLVAVSIISTNLFRILLGHYEYQAARTTDLICLGTLLFILGTAAIVVYSRADLGVGPLITSRYKIYSFLLLIIGYLYVVIPIRGSFLSPYVSGIVFLTVLYNIFSYHYHLVDAFNLRKQLVTMQFNNTILTKNLRPDKDTSFVANLVADTPVFYEKWLHMVPVASRQQFAGTTRGLVELYNQTTIQPTNDAIQVRNEQYTSQLLQDSGVYILLSSKNRYYLYPAYRTRNTNRKQLFLKQHYFASGFGVDIPFGEIEAGRYAVGLVRQQGERVGIYFGKDSITTKAVEQEIIRKNW
ncbi:hypothetical protein [Telluribacter sp. SYSU D00476]|uniref:hypothetical protein n=1 Tax=Telluribacter sp. SYSU D00476 TaxID=2811430 RepID=UPI001FF2EC7B|nr:hypothetical protein [Telluribacter sp. SYSU D00476]